MRSIWTRAPILPALVLTLSGALAFACTSRSPVGGPARATPTATPLVTGPDDGLAELPPDPRERPLTEIVSVLLTEKHVLQKPIDDKLSREAFPKYIEELDGSKLLLLEEHRAALAKYADLMDDEMKEHNLVLAHKAAALIAARRKKVAQMVADLVKHPFDFSVAQEVETDPKKRDFCKSDQDLAERWRGELKLQALERIQQMEDLLENKGKPGKDQDAAEDAATGTALKDIPASFEGREEKARKELGTRYQTRFKRLSATDPLEPAELFLNAIAAVYDPHTQYMAPAEKADFDIALSGQLEGIGAVLGEKDHYIVVQELVPGGASWRDDRLGAGDLILAVAQARKSPVDVTDMPIEKVVKMIRGRKGTVVTLTVKKPEGQIENIAITRDVVKVEATYARGATLELPKTKGMMGYVYLPGFYGELGAGRPQAGERNATDDVRQLLVQFQKKKFGGVIIDLRGNGGGLLNHARDISGLFIPRGPVVQTRDSDGKIEVLSDTDPSVSFSGDVVVMVDRFSASAAEILTAALQDYERAVIVGTGPTHGKGTVQAVVELDRFLEAPAPDSLGVFKLTIEQYFRVNGGSVQWKGVTPDIVLPDPASFVESGERTLFHSIPWTSVDPLRYQKEHHGWVLSALAKASHDRVEHQPLFAKVESFGKLVKARRDQTRVSIERKAWLEKRKQDKAALDAADPKLEKQTPLVEVQVVIDPKLPPTVSDDKKVKKKLDAWKDELARDPWVAESLHVLEDMGQKK
jgi:carboxyl-terminal processing protease